MEPGQPDPGVPPPVDVPDAGSPVAEEAYTPVAVAEAELHKKGEEAHYAALELADAAPPALVDFDAVAAPPAPVNGAAADAAADAGAAAPVDDEPVVIDDEPVVLDDEPVVLDDEPVVLADAAAPPAVALDADLQSTAKTLASPASDASEPAAARFDEPAEPAA
ncbi:hypothetical protein JL722_13578 [Aureococcus anophagefferens]|nr:hypothetical protein JL722_13578 [Aureococcus anophagefferens]